MVAVPFGQTEEMLVLAVNRSLQCVLMVRAAVVEVMLRLRH